MRNNILLCLMNKLLSFALIFLSALSMKAQTKAESAQVFYPVGGTSIQKSYKDNAAQLQHMKEAFSKHNIDWTRYRVVVRSSSSPEGRESFNNKISELRANAMADYLVKHVDISREHINIISQRVDWTELRRLIQESTLGSEAVPYVNYLDSVMTAVNNGQDIKDSEILQGLKSTYHGWKYPFIRRYLFPRLRYARATLEPIDGLQEAATPLRPDESVTIPPVTVPETAFPEKVVPETPRDTVAATPVVPSLRDAERRPLYLAAKTNLLYDAVLTPNIALEWAFADHWSVSANWMYAWWSNRAKHRFWRIYGGDLEMRYWMGGEGVKPLTGHHFGVYGGILTYDFEFGGKGYLGDKWSYHFGLSYGYSMPIARRLNLDFELGIGYLGGKYHEYEPFGNEYHWLETKQRHWFGPTRAEVSLVWLLFNRNK